MYNNDITKRVNRILYEYNIDRCPIPVGSIAERLGLRIIEESFLEDISGILDLRDNTKPLIFVNKSQHINRQRFSIAHEIGHFVLHKPLGIHVDKQSYFRSAKSAETLEEYEIDANKFATALLMPEYLISRELSEDSDWLDTDNDVISSLADKFEVSVTAMSYRLQNLGYLQ